MLIPFSHEHLEGRRWPWVTIAIIVLNLIAFGVIYSELKGDAAAQMGRVKARIILLAAVHPNVEMPPQAHELVDKFKKLAAPEFEQLKSRDRRPEPVVGMKWDLEMREFGPLQAEEEMTRLVVELGQLEAASRIEKYAYYASKHDLYRYVTANFLHGGWMHIIFNMWFLWLAGTVLEDAWGRAIYSAFYFLAGGVALYVQGASNPDSLMGVIGASGAVAGLMGAFLVRNAKTKIEFGILYFFPFLPRFYRFKAPAYVMLPLWLLAQFFSASLVGGGGGVAYWAHIGGFLFGVVVAVALKTTGIEHKVNKAIEAEVGWEADPRMTKAGEMAATNPNGATAELESLLQEKPDMVEAYDLMARVCWNKGDVPGHNKALAQVVRLRIKAKDMDAALQTYDELNQQQGEEKIAPAEWLQLCRWLENQPNWDRAAVEYERFSHAYPADKMAVYALVCAGRINLKNLQNRTEAARLYKEADASPVPHLDWEEAIKRGLRDSTSAPLPA